MHDQVLRLEKSISRAKFFEGKYVFRIARPIRIQMNTICVGLYASITRIRDILEQAVSRFQVLQDNQRASRFGDSK